MADQSELEIKGALLTNAAATLSLEEVEVIKLFVNMMIARLSVDGFHNSLEFSFTPTGRADNCTIGVRIKDSFRLRITETTKELVRLLTVTH